MEINRIELIQVGDFPLDFLVLLRALLSDTLGLNCRVGSHFIDPEDAFDARRRQFNSTAILNELLKLPLGPDVKVLGLAEVDLFIPIFTFVFGEAQLGGRAGLVSAHRLRQSFYGLPDDEALFASRCEKEALHELGHTFNLIHCELYTCVMHFSNTVEQVDLKENRFCPRCRKALGDSREEPAWPPGVLPIF